MHDDPNQLLRKTYPRTDPRLGRNMVLDARSLAYMVERMPEELRRPLQSIHHHRVLPILDQGNLGSCTGNAGTGALGTHPLLKLPPETDATEGERYARQLYADATVADPFPGAWPPDDTGSDGLSICKVLLGRGLITGYRHASTLQGFVMLLQDGPVLLGMPWMGAFFDPDADGYIDVPGWEDSGVAGGHEVEVLGVDLEPVNVATHGRLPAGAFRDATTARSLGRDVDRTAFRATFMCVNSWGSSWGINGRFLMRGSTYVALRDDIDLQQPVG